MPDINLDAARAGRVREPIGVVFAGDRYEIPGEPPAMFAIAFGKGDLEGGLVALFGQEEATRMLAGGLSIPDLEYLAGQIAAAYGIGGSPESSASERSASRT